MFTKSDNKRNNERLAIQLYRDYGKLGATTLNGISTILGTIKIIEHFKPKVGVIENPATSKIGEFIKENELLSGVLNKAHYNNYDESFTKKPTIFFSNIDLGLDKSNKTGNVQLKDIGCYDKRSAIPTKLLNDIYSKIEEHINGISE